MAKKKSQGIVARDQEVPRLWTGEAVLDRALELAGFQVADLRSAMAVTRESLSAVLPEKVKRTTEPDGKVREEIQEGGAPDWDARHRGADQIYSFLGFRSSRKPAEGADPARPISVNIVLVSPSASGPNGHARPALQGRGLAIHLTGDQPGDR